jgi:hypothetical protein
MVQPTYTGPAHPIGYVELQGSYTGHVDPEKGLELFDELMAKAAREHPGLLTVNTRWETTKDGAGVKQQHLYLGFAPPVPSSEPLDPHNLNDAPMPQPGMPEPTDGIMPLGSRERKF